MHRGWALCLIVVLATACQFDPTGLTTRSDSTRDHGTIDAQTDTGGDTGADAHLDSVSHDTLSHDTVSPDTGSPDTVPHDTSPHDLTQSDGPKKPLGAPCLSPAECASGYCVKETDKSSKICCSGACKDCDGCKPGGQGCDC